MSLTENIKFGILLDNILVKCCIYYFVMFLIFSITKIGMSKLMQSRIIYLSQFLYCSCRFVLYKHLHTENRRLTPSLASFREGGSVEDFYRTLSSILSRFNKHFIMERLSIRAIHLNDDRYESLNLS